MRPLRLTDCLAAAAPLLLVTACMMTSTEDVQQHLWWTGFGPVLPHDTFPADCSMCHVGDDWKTLTEDFHFDHEAETGYALEGSHAGATCLRCHNDRGPAAVFSRRGCAGCHEDLHRGQLGTDCTSCHQQVSWEPVGQIAMHDRTRFPLAGVHASTSCRRCHPGAEVGVFRPVDIECVTCHQSDLAAAKIPDHIALNMVDRCDRCHLPRTWQKFEL